MPKEILGKEVQRLLKQGAQVFDVLEAGNQPRLASG